MRLSLIREPVNRVCGMAKIPCIPGAFCACAKIYLQHYHIISSFVYKKIVIFHTIVASFSNLTALLP